MLSTFDQHRHPASRFEVGRAAVLSRQQFGRKDGVTFLQIDHRLFVAKMARNALHEVFFARLAQRVGLLAPSIVHVELQPDAAWVNLLGGGLPAPIMVMSHMDGKTFAYGDWGEADRIDIEQYTPRGRQWVFNTARVCAFDYFIRNVDRFPVRGLGARNPGNLMMRAADGSVVCIDNTTCAPRMASDASGSAAYLQTLASILALAHTADDVVAAETEACLRNIVTFFPAGTRVLWETIRHEVFAGLRAGISAIAQVSAAELRTMLAAVGGDKYLHAALQQMLYAHLQLFAQASAAREERT